MCIVLPKFDSLWSEKHPYLYVYTTGNLRDVFRQNGYNSRQIHNILSSGLNISKLNKKPIWVAFLLYVGPACNRILRVLA
jgi:hypothetical protein